MNPLAGNLVVPVRRLRDGFPDNMNSRKILTLRMDGAVTLFKLQLSFAGTHPLSGAK